jgi:butyrate kinase
MRRGVSCHNLNARFMCHRLADEIHKPFKDCRIIVVHMGGGISVCAFKDGRAIDSCFVSDGPMTPTRSGALPTRNMVDLCFSGKYTYDQMRKIIISKGGLMAHLGTSDTIEVEKRIAAGDDYAELVYKAMAYQISKCVGQMASVLYGKVDGIILTGGLANSDMQTDLVKERVQYIAPVYRYPGEDEMQALAAGALRALNGEEPIQDYDLLPANYKSKGEFYAKFNLFD